MRVNAQGALNALQARAASHAAGKAGPGTATADTLEITDLSTDGTKAWRCAEARRRRAEELMTVIARRWATGGLEEPTRRR